MSRKGHNGESAEDAPRHRYDELENLHLDDEDIEVSLTHLTGGSSSMKLSVFPDRDGDPATGRMHC